MNASFFSFFVFFYLEVQVVYQILLARQLGCHHGEVVAHRAQLTLVVLLHGGVLLAHLVLLQPRGAGLPAQLLPLAPLGKQPRSEGLDLQLVGHGPAVGQVPAAYQLVYLGLPHRPELLLPGGHHLVQLSPQTVCGHGV